MPTHFNPHSSEHKTENQVILAIHKHRTIRKFKKEKEIPEKHVKMIIETGQRAATSCSGQMYSILRVKNKDLREKVTTICGGQQFIRDASEFFLILADSYRLQKLVGKSGGTKRSWPVLSLLVSTFDAGLFSQNMVLAAESLGYGTVFSGVCGDKALELIEELNLPKGVLPLAGLAIGIPSEDPPVRPRIPLKYVLHEDKYYEYKDQDLDDMINFMSTELEKEGYYRKYTGREDYTWRNHVARKFGGKWLEREDKRRRQALEKQGFL